MNSTAKSILGVIGTLAFIVGMAAVLAGIGFVILVFALYYTMVLFLDYGLIAGALAIVALFAVLIIATRSLIKRIQRG
jgi:hypothetical protein